MDNQLVGNRYQVLSKIGGGGMGTVYRALDRLTNQVIALKRVSISGSLLDSMDTSSDFRLALAQEFRVLSSLHHPNIISVLDYGFDAERRPYFTMELLEKAQTIVEVTANQPLDYKMNMFVQLLQALSYLHRRGVIHRDLKPDNVMVMGNQVKVLDFGLAAALDATHEQESENVVGTLAYMAPEILAGDTASEASDLYAAGLIGYEIIAREGPFSTSDFTTLLEDIARRVPDVSILDVNSEIQDVLATLLEKDPQQRFSDAQTTIIALNDATQFVLEYENSLIRESFLKAATFVGRSDELTRLLSALHDARHNNKGSAWLIGGESGVGKSRLMDEFRTQALVTGAQVLRGQAIVEGGAPYFEWLPILRLLVLQTNLSQLEASVLKEIIPDIENLLEEDVPDAPDIDAAGAQIRLLNVIQDLFERQQNPILILLEDLHWSNESLNVLRRLNDIVATRPIMIVGNYRNEEKPDLPKSLPRMELLELKRLSRDEISELSQSIAGAGGKRNAVIELLERETEGNVFFIIEVMRVLADEAGHFADIGHMTLPASVFAGGIKTVVERRLNQLPDFALPLLEFAAIAGKDVDLALIRHINTDVDIDRWLTLCADVNVLEVQNNQWRFAHDKLRDGLTLKLSDTERRALHKQVAETIEAVYPNDKTRLVNLAYHWDKAVAPTNIEKAIVDKAIYYLEQSADQAIENNLHDEGLHYMERLFARDKQRAEQTKYNATKDEQAHWHYLLGQALYGVRRLEDSQKSVEKAVQLYGFPIPQSTWGLRLGIASQIIKQMIYNRLPDSMVEIHSEEERQRRLRASEALRFAGSLYYFSHEQIKSLYTTLLVVNVAERAGISAELAQAYGLMCTLIGNFQSYKVAESYYQQALEVATAVQDPVAFSEVYFITGIYHNLAGMHDECISDLTHAAQYHEQTGNAIGWGYSMITIASTYIYKGEYKRAYEIFQQVLDSDSSHLAEHKLTALSLQARIEVQLNQLDSALEKSEEAIQILQTEMPDAPQVAVNPWALYSRVQLERGAYDAAYEATSTTHDLIKQAQLNATLGFSALGIVAEIYLELYDLPANQRPASGDELLSKAKSVIDILKVFPAPIGKAMALRCQGWLAWIDGQTGKAEKFWQQSIDVAEKIGMPFDVAQTHVVWGRHLPSANPDRNMHLEQAAKLFDEMELSGALERVKRL